MEDEGTKRWTPGADEDMDEGSSAGNWIKLIGIVVGIGAAIFLTLVFITDALLKWGIVGGFIVLGGVLLVFGFLYDRRQARAEF
jgi:hypothetical protein